MAVYENNGTNVIRMTTGSDSERATEGKQRDSDVTAAY
jgi:hypothetical protein